MRETSLRKLLRERTIVAHADLERTPLMQAFATGDPDPRRYLDYLGRQLRLHRGLELALSSHVPAEWAGTRLSKSAWLAADLRALDTPCDVPAAVAPGAVLGRSAGRPVCHRGQHARSAGGAQAPASRTPRPARRRSFRRGLRRPVGRSSGALFSLARSLARGRVGCRRNRPHAQPSKCSIAYFRSLAHDRVQGNTPRACPANVPWPEGEVTVENCAREPIHVPGLIQPHGALVAFDPASGAVLHASSNLGAWLPLGESAGAGTPDPGTVWARRRAQPSWTPPGHHRRHGPPPHRRPARRRRAPPGRAAAGAGAPAPRGRIRRTRAAGRHRQAARLDAGIQ